MPDLIAIFFVMVLAGAVQGATGFGSGLLAVAVLGMIGSGLKDASVVLVLPTIFLCLALLLRLRQHLRLDRVGPLVVGAVVAIPFGVLLLKHAPPHTLYLILGLLLIGSVVQRIIPRAAEKRWHPIWLGVPCGLLSGILGGAFNTGGPPVVAYVATQRFDRFRYVAVLQFVFVLYGCTRLIFLVTTGLMTGRLFGLSAVGAAGSVAGALLGLRVLRKMSDRLLGRIVAAALFLLGVRYLCLAFA